MAGYRQAMLALLLAGCGATELFGRYDVPEAPGTADAPWPRLADTPQPPPAGTYDAAVPDPARGIASAVALDLAAGEAERRRTATVGAVVDAAALRARAKAAEARARTLSEPVLSETDRRRLLEAAQR